MGIKECETFLRNKRSIVEEQCRLFLLFMYFEIRNHLRWQLKTAVVRCLETFSVHDGRSGLVVLGLGDPHLLESGQRGENGTSDPYGVFSFWWGNNLNLHCGWRKGGELFGHSLCDAREHSRAARHDNVGVQVFTNINVALHDGLESAVVDA